MRLESAQSKQGIVFTYNRCGAIADLLVLKLSEVNENFSCRVLHFEQSQNGGTVVGDCHVLKSTEKAVKLKSQGLYHRCLLTPISSTSILSSPIGPREDLTTLAIAEAAMTGEKPKISFWKTVISKLLPFWVRTFWPETRWPATESRCWTDIIGEKEWEKRLQVDRGLKLGLMEEKSANKLDDDKRRARRDFTCSSSSSCTAAIVCSRQRAFSRRLPFYGNIALRRPLDALRKLFPR